MNRRNLVAVSCKASELEEQLAASITLYEEGARFVDPATLPSDRDLIAIDAQLARLIREGRPKR